jgi:hypothetical protein
LHGTSATKAEWRADTAAKAKAAAERELALRTQMKSLADQLLGVDGKFTKHIDDEVSSYVVAKNPARPECRVSDADARRLLSIR